MLTLTTSSSFSKETTILFSQLLYYGDVLSIDKIFLYSKFHLKRNSVTKNRKTKDIELCKEYILKIYKKVVTQRGF